MKMWCKTIYMLIIATFLLVTIVKGSCLEYGHSCWGAHGKRSGSSGGGKLLRDSLNIRNTEVERNSAIKANQSPSLSSLDDIKNHYSQDDSNGVNSLNFRDIPRLKNLFRKQSTAELRNQDRNRQISVASLEQENEQSDRWLRLPSFNFRPKTQMENSENEVLHQPPKSMVLDENFYYDSQ